MSGSAFEITNTIVRAGAGAGKTTELVARVLHAADTMRTVEGKFPRLIVTTFTRKATQELKERLLQKAIEMNRPDLEEFLKRPSHIHISTIHGILNLFLVKFGSHLGMAPQFTILSSIQEHQLEKRALRELLKEESFRNSFSQLQEMASVKDILLSFRDYFHFWCESKDLKPIEQSELQMMAEEEWKKFLLTSLQFAQKIRQDTDKVKWLEFAAYLDDLVSKFKGLSFAANFESIMTSLENKAGPNKDKTISGPTLTVREEWQELRVQLQHYSCHPSSWLQHQTMAKLFVEVAERFNQKIFELKIQMGQIGMADLENFSLLLLRQSPEIGVLFSESWDYWLIDEYQDTAPRQVQLLNHLIGKRPRFLVGDPQQSIYLFRGARSEVFSQAVQWIQKQKGVLAEKSVNYRSQPGLLEFFNSFFRSIGPQFQPMLPSPSKLAHQTSVSPPVAHFFKAIEGSSELNAVLFRIQKLLDIGTELGDICILSRTNQNLEELAELAEARGIPVQVHSAAKFYERREIVDALSLLKFLLNPHDNLNFMQLLRSPWFLVDDNEILSFCHTKSQSFWSRSLASEHPCLVRLRAALETSAFIGYGEAWFECLRDSGMLDWSAQIDPTGRREANLWKLISSLKLLERRPGFSYLDFIQSKESESIDLESSGEADATPVVEPSRVQLMTIHASKGLQFKHVVLLGCGDYRANVLRKFLLFDEATLKWTLNLPEPEEGKSTTSLLGKQIQIERQRRELEEYDRLLYVALTRAEESVSLCSDHKMDRHSWASRWPFETASGLHSAENFCYNVHCEDFIVRQSILEKPPFREVKDRLINPAHKSLRTVSVTEILSQKINEEMRQQTKPSHPDPESLRKALRGTDVHALFESLKYREVEPQLSDEWQAALHFTTSWQSGTILQVIENGEVEWGFGLKFDSLLIQGQIDLWGQDRSGQYWIVDYKTGSAKYVEKAFSQLQLYVYALQSMKKIPLSAEIKLAAVYPFSEKIEVRKSPTFSDCEEVVRSLVADI